MKAIVPIDAKNGSQHVISRLCEASITENIRTDQAAQIRSFAANFKRFAQTPKYIQLVIQPEFKFEAFIDTYAITPNKANIEELTSTAWPHRVFVLIEHHHIDEWMNIISKKIRLEEDSVIVCLIPSRTGASFFHDYVLKLANEVRFIKGTTTVPATEHNLDRDFNDHYCLAIYRNEFTPVASVTIGNDGQKICSIIAVGTSIGDVNTEVSIEAVQNTVPHQKKIS